MVAGSKMMRKTHANNSFILVFCSILFLILLPKTLHACPCFNEYYLKTAFSLKNNLVCHIVKINDDIKAIMLTDGKNFAQELHGKCELHVDHYAIKRDYDIDSLKNSTNITSCLDIILNVCKSLGANIIEEKDKNYDKKE